MWQGIRRRFFSPRGLLLLVCAGLVLATAWNLTAYPRGMLMAYTDHARGHYELQMGGLPYPWEGDAAHLLNERYNVRLRWVCGCVITWTPSQEWYPRGYNSVSQDLLIEKYGKDVYEECFQDARERWEADHPDQARQLFGAGR